MRHKIFTWIILISLLLGIIAFLFVNFTDHEQNYRVDGLHPEIQKATTKLIKQSQQQGIEIKITQGFRSTTEQNKLYAQGRIMPGPIVTHAKGGESFHNFGLAVDFVIVDPATKKLSWDKQIDTNKNGQSDWQDVATIGKKLGFDWGGDWQGFKDLPHLEMTFGQSIWEVQMKAKLERFLN